MVFTQVSRDLNWTWVLRISYESAVGSKQKDRSGQILRMFPVITEIYGGEWYMCSYLFSHVEIESWLQAIKNWGRYERANSNRVDKSKLLILSPICLTSFFWIAFTVPVLKLLNLHTVVFMQYQKKYSVFHFAFISR